MNFFTVKETTHFKNKVFGEGELLQGETYFSYTQFAEDAADRGFGEIVNIDPAPFIIIDQENLEKQDLSSKKILLFFAGGYGDALMLGMILPSIEKKLGVKFDLCCSKEKWLDIFRPLNIGGAWVSYPLPLRALSFYDGIITDITRFFTTEGNKVSPILQLCRGFGLDPEKMPKVEYRIDNEAEERLRLPYSSTPRIGVNLDSNGSVKSYPPGLHIELVKRLKAIGFEIFLLGRRNSTEAPSISGDLAFDLRDKTTIRDLAALIKQLDIVIGMDSFICHMANILDVPALVLLSTTSPDFFSLHSNITCISSRLECAPCYQVFDACPLDNKECLAFYHDSIAPSIIASAALEQLIKSFKKKIAGDSERFPLSHAPCATNAIHYNLHET
jgi:hypothetical protein